MLWAIRAIHELDPNFVRPGNMYRMHTLLNYAEDLIRKLPSAFQCTLLLRLYSARIVLHIIAVKDKEANHVRKNNLVLIED